MKKVTVIIVLTFLNNALCQEKNEPQWWAMERDGNYLEMASHLLFMVQSDSTRNNHADYMHIARAYAYLDDYEKAIFYWKKSMKGLSESNDMQYWWYFKGTLAFFERNREELFKYMNLLKNNHSQYYANNAKTLEALYNNYEKGYKLASQWK